MERDAVKRQNSVDTVCRFFGIGDRTGGFGDTAKY